MSDPTDLLPKRPRVWPLVVAGMLLVAAAIAIGQYYDVARYANLDFRGARATGSIQYNTNANGDTLYVIRFTDTDGSIYRSQYHGPFFFGPPADGADLPIRYNPDEPGDFQPAGVSYLPGAITLIFFFAGMFTVITARNRITRHVRRLHGRVA